MHALPQPDDDARRLSESLIATIREEIAARGPMDFARYMELALYAPGLGYYAAGSEKFGAAGDFVTAPELGPLFGQCMAHALVPVLGQFRQAQIVELGAGSGALVCTLLPALGALGALPARYAILEISADLRARQQEAIRRHCPMYADRVVWLNAPPASPWQGALVANEVPDALPVRRFVLRDHGCFALAVDASGDGGLATVELPADAALARQVAAIEQDLEAPLPRPYVSELCAMLPAWLHSVTARMERGVALFFDYGYPRREYYLAERRGGTLVCHYRHRAHADAMVWPGLQDITAFVDFTALAEAGVAAGLTLAAYCSQAQFLLNNGLMERLAGLELEEVSARQSRINEAKRLTLPGEMGERYQAMAFARDVEDPFPQLDAADLSHRL
ncbi:MAG TPA: SAM-dependent methyltransferase [Xanthomonadaceae bacterium]|nr:SAM-dependent methyltransferase [Xanthomonadaceae bacterium]